jgi:hypothetical protein
MIARLKSDKGRESYALRMQSVEPVLRQAQHKLFGTLQQYYGIRWINARGKDCANKIMLMVAAALNLIKWLKNQIENTTFLPLYEFLNLRVIKMLLGRNYKIAILDCSPKPCSMRALVMGVWQQAQCI